MTGGIKIPIDADLSPLNQAMDQFASKAKSALGNLHGTASLDTGSAQKSLEELQKAALELHNQLGKTAVSDVTGKSLQGLSKNFEAAVGHAKKLEQAVGGVGKGASGFNKTVTETRKLIAELEKAKRLQEALAKAGQKVSLAQASEIEKDYQFHIKQGGKAYQKRFEKFGDLATVMNNWRDISSNEVASRRQFKDLMGAMGLPGAAPASPGGGGNPQQRTIGQFVADSLRQAGRGVGQTVTGGAGVGGTIMGHAAEEAAAHGGLFSAGGMTRLAAGATIGGLAYGAVRGIASVKNHINSSEDEMIAYSDMSRRLGDASASFGELRDSVRSAAKNLDMSFGDGAKMAQGYISAAGIDGLSANQIKKELLGAGGFARSLGQDPEAGASLMATLRHTKVSSGEADNKRFALMIGEAVARAGVFTKADEVLSAVASYTQQATRAGLSSANTEGYLGGLTNLMALNQAGLDPSMSAAILGKADHAIRGNTSEAARNFFLGTMQRQAPGMTAVDLGFLQDQGAFGTRSKAFGEGSIAWKAAEGDEALRAKYRRLSSGPDANKTNLDAIMDGMRGMSSDDMRKNLMGYMGMSDSEAAAMIAAYKANGDMSSSSSRIAGQYGLDPKSISATGMKHLLDMEYSNDPDILQKKVNFLQGQNLSKGDRDMLNGALKDPGEGNGNLRTVLASLLAKQNMEMDQGAVARASKASLDNMASDLATKLIPMTNSIREAVVATANVLTLGAFKDNYASPESLAAIDEAHQNLTRYGAAEPGQGDSPKNVPLDMSDKSLAGIYKNNPQYDDLFKRAGEKYGVDWRVLKQIAVQESALNPRAEGVNKNGTRDRGLMQLNNRYDKERGVTDPYNVEQNVMAGAGVFARALRDSNGDLRGAFRRYNGSGPQAEAYADKAMRNYHMLNDAPASAGTPLPPGAKASQAPAPAQTVRVEVSGKVTQEDKNGRPVGPPIPLAQAGAPQAAGVR